MNHWLSLNRRGFALASALHLQIVVGMALVIGAMPSQAADYPLKPVPFNQVKMTSDFWRPRLETQRKTLVPWAFARTERGVDHLKTARDYLAGKKVEGHRAHRFIDSDLYKVMEGAAYLLQLRRDPELEAKLTNSPTSSPVPRRQTATCIRHTQRASARRRT